jgi:hypothetical protein
MKRMRLLLPVLLLMAAAGPAIGQSTEKAREVRLTLSPAAEPRPALKYHLLPLMVEQAPGDGMAAYTSATSAFEQTKNDTGGEMGEKILDWVEVPAEQVDWAGARGIADRLSGQLSQVDAAARYKSHEWNLPFETEGLYLQMPTLSNWRFAAKIVALRTRVAVYDGRLEDALRSLQTNLAMAQDVADGPTLIQELVGIAIARLAAQGIEDFISKPDSPNLYWALSSLPDPLISASKGLQGESYVVLATWPELKEGANARLSGDQWDALLRKMVKSLSELGAGEGFRQESLTMGVIQAYPKAKEYFRSQGMSAQQVEAMPVGKAVLLYSLRDYEWLRDENFKWWNVPFWQAWPHMRKAEAMIDEAKAAGRGVPFITLVPALSKARTQFVRLDKQLATLRVIEAIRIYAAAHDGQLPATLADIQEVPIPINPITGEEFPYRLEGSSAVLEAPSLEGLPESYDTRYILTIRK